MTLTLHEWIYDKIIVEILAEIDCLSRSLRGLNAFFWHLLLENRFAARYISFAVLLAIIVVIGALFYKVMIGFFVPVFLAAVLVVVFRPLHRWVCAKVGDREHIAAI